jgi:hypothetical protein
MIAVSVAPESEASARLIHGPPAVLEPKEPTKPFDNRRSRREKERESASSLRVNPQNLAGRSAYNEIGANAATTIAITPKVLNSFLLRACCLS